MQKLYIAIKFDTNYHKGLIMSFLKDNHCVNKTFISDKPGQKI